MQPTISLRDVSSAGFTMPLSVEDISKHREAGPWIKIFIAQLNIPGIKVWGANKRGYIALQNHLQCNNTDDQRFKKQLAQNIYTIAVKGVRYLLYKVGGCTVRTRCNLMYQDLSGCVVCTVRRVRGNIDRSRQERI